MTDSVAQIAPVATVVAIPVDGNGSDVVAIQNPGEAVAATVIEPPEGWVSADPTKLLQRSSGVTLVKPHQYRIDPPPGQDVCERAIFVQRVKDLASGEVIADVRIESQDAKRGQRTVKLTAPNGRLLASVDKPPRAAEDALVDEPSIFSVDGQPYATFHPPDSATSYGKLVRGEGSSNGLKIEGRKTLKRLYGTLGVAAGVLVIAVGGIGMAVGVPGLMYACIYVALFVFVFGLCAGNCSPSSYGVFSLDGSVSYPRVYAKPSHTKCAMSSQADDSLR